MGFYQFSDIVLCDKSSLTNKMLTVGCCLTRLSSTCSVQASRKISKIGFIGLGNMGSEMCKNLLAKKWDVTVKDLDPGKEQALAKEGARVATNLEELAKESECVITMVPASQHLLSLYQGDTGLIKYIKPGTTAIDCSTVDYSTTKIVGELLKTIDVSLIDAPVSGGVLAASKGTLTFMVGGEEDTLKKVGPILKSMGSKIFHCGSLGNGQITKMCNNLLLGIAAVGVSEAFHLGVKLGMDPKVLTSVINESSGKCWVTDTYHPVPNVLEGVPSSKGYQAGFTCQMILKDLEIAQRTANEMNCVLPLGEIVIQMYKDVCRNKLSDKDFTIVFDYICKMLKHNSKS